MAKAKTAEMRVDITARMGYDLYDADPKSRARCNSFRDHHDNPRQDEINGIRAHNQRILARAQNLADS